MNLGAYFSELVSAAIGTFVGAYAAFALERGHRADEQKKLRAAEGNLAILTLFQMWNVLRQYQKEVIEPAPDHKGRWLAMKATLPQSAEHVGFDPVRLEFLFESENKNLLPQLLLEERRFQIALAMINRRSTLMLEKVFPALEAKGVKEGTNLEEGVARAMLGPSLAAEVVQTTESIVQNVNEDVESIKATYEELRKQLVLLLPSAKLIQLGFDEQPRNPQDQRRLNG
ncbi:MAG: hypothetical protein ACREV2_00665 [Burkholderiales bacterium]